MLYLNSNEAAFAMGILGPLLLLILSWREKLYAEPVLQLVYMISAVVGWYNVQSGWEQWHIGTGTHVLLFLLSVSLAVVWGFVLQRYTSANFPQVGCASGFLGHAGDLAHDVSGTCVLVVFDRRQCLVVVHLLEASIVCGCVHVFFVSGDGCRWIFCSEVVRVLNHGGFPLEETALNKGDFFEDFKRWELRLKFIPLFLL